MMANGFFNVPQLPAGWQAHHLLSPQLLSDPFVERFHSAGLLNLNDFATNGSALPSNQLDAALSGLSLHSGFHSQYNQFAELLVSLATDGFNPQNATTA